MPTGAETCPFCIMLASRGFAYHSEETASHAHAHCDCRMVPFWGRKRPALEGYDPDLYYDMWKHPEKYEETNAMDGFAKMHKEMKERHGDEVSGMAVFQTRDIKPHELRAYLALMEAKIDFTVRPVSIEARARGFSSPDVLLDGKIWELKCPDGANPKKTISRNINKAIRQMLDTDPPLDELRIIVSALETPLTDEQVLFQVDRVLESTRENLVEIMVIKKNGQVVRRKR